MSFNFDVYALTYVYCFSAALELAGAAALRHLGQSIQIGIAAEVTESGQGDVKVNNLLIDFMSLGGEKHGLVLHRACHGKPRFNCDVRQRQG